MGDLIVGALLRSLRKQAGRSQAEQAAALSALADRAVTRNDVSRWENEVRLPTPYWQGFYAASFENVTADDIKAAVIATRQSRRRKDHGQETVGRDSVQRRDFIGTFAGLAVSLPSLSLGAITSSITRPGQLAVDPLVVDDFISLRTALVSADSMLGPGNLVNSTKEQVANIASLYECIEPQARARLFEIGALFAEFCGWLADDLGKFDSGKVWSTQALEWAHSSGNSDIAAYVLMRMSQQAQFTRRKAQASALAQASIDYEARVGNTQVLAAMHQQAAHANAMDGQERVALRHIDKAYNLAEATAGSNGRSDTRI